MSDIKSRVQGIDPNVNPRDVRQMAESTGNIYEVLSVIMKRAKVLSVDMKEELHKKLDEFAVTTETIEEVQENKEQIEISKFYERLPNAVIIAMDEFLKDDLEFEYKEKVQEENL